MESTRPDISSLRIKRTEEASTPDRKMPWKYILPGGVLLIAVAGYFLLGSSLKSPRQVELTSAAMTFPSQANALLTASGYVVAQVKAAVATKGSGRLVFLGVEEGDRVKKGQILARLEDADMIAALEGAKANLGVAQADYADAKRTLERAETLFSAGLISKAEIDAAKSRFDRVDASIRSARAGVNSAEVSLENTRIRAPFDGTVLTKNADVGEVFAPFASSANSRGAVVTMADMSSLQVEADVSEANIINVHPGQPCEIILDAYPDKRYAGSVHKIVPTADRAKATVLTKVSFNVIDGRVLPEMSAKVIFLAKEPDHTASAAQAARLTVPVSCVTPRNGGKAVLLVRDNSIVETPVTVGDVIGDRIEIREGLSAGDQLVLRPDPTLTTGTPVRAPGK